jgi:hypothetical protein
LGALTRPAIAVLALLSAAHRLDAFGCVEAELDGCLADTRAMAYGKPLEE